MHKRRRVALVAMVAAAAAVCGCGSRERDTATSAQRTSGLPAFFPADALRLGGPGDLVLAEGEHGILLTLAEYNARVGEEPLMADVDTVMAQRMLLDRLVDYKVAAVEAKLRGMTAKDATTSAEAERELAKQILQGSIMEAATISDEDARARARADSKQFGDVKEKQLQDRGFLMHVKYVIENDRLRDKLTSWQQRERVVVHRDRFEALQRGETLPASTVSSKEH